MKTNDLDTNNPAIESAAIPEQPKCSKEKTYRRLTPEQRVESEAVMDRTLKAIIEGLHKDNLEIFGEDYIKK